ncbi:MAG: carboxypeptidase regulatory-like domain-containing protein, partial [Actinobacteria bacterium]
MVMRPSAIEGTVTLGANPYAIVTAYLEDAGEISYAGVATATVPDGHYRIGGLAAGNYLLRFVAEGGDQEWYNATSTVAAATRIVLAPETTQSGYGADFSGPTVFGSIRGAVTDEQGDVAAPGIAVSAYAQDGSGWDLVETTLTAPTGLFNLTGLPSGVYRVGCEDPSGRLLPEFYDGAYSVAGGDDVTVTAPAATTGIDVSLDRASAVRGQVRNRLGVPVGPMNVYAYRQYGSAWVTAGTAASNPSTGLYTIGGLLPGTYSVRFAGDGAYRGEFYDDRHGDISTAQTFTVSLATTVSAIDAVVEPRNTLAPVTTSDAPSGWRSRTASVSLTATDNQAVYATWYSTGGATTTYTPGAKIGITAEGTTTLRFRSADIVGNFESTRTATVLIDTVAPVTMDDAADEYDGSEKVIVHLTPSDATSGIRRTLYAVDGAAASMGTVVEVEGVGPHTVQYRSQDAAGNWEATKTAAFTIHAAQVSVAGADRFGTCVLASQRGFAGGADTVVIATGRNWP